ncbi:MAG: hypothetical protein NUV60_00175 [Patescibacteria group bacterium]|nr:hypothetical protein [Patescibacteria group bacterium]
MMKVTARPVTDSRGYQAVGGFFLGDLKAHPLGESIKSVWQVEVKLRPRRLVELFGGKFDLLVRRLVDVDGYSINTGVEAGSLAGVQVVRISGTEFRERGAAISSRKL